MLNYSIIIPHHNCPKLLNRCIESIPQRNDVEIIVVDDNSDEDMKPNLLRSDIKLISIDGDNTRGAGRARNYALKHARGKWLLFADADDFYTDFLPILLDKYANDNFYDIVYLNACIFDERGVESPFKTEKLINNFLLKKNGSEMHLKYDLWTPWSRMVKRRMVLDNNIFFDEIPAGNDIMFCLKCSRYATEIAAENTCLYKYFKPLNGSPTDKARTQMIDFRLDLKARIIAFYKSVGYKNSDNLLSIVIRQRGVGFWELMNKYKKYLSAYEILMAVDVWNFLNCFVKFLLFKIKSYESKRNY